MSGEFDQYAGAEPRLSDRVGVQQGVGDSSSATKMSAFAGIAQPASQAMGLYSGYKREQEREAVEQDAQARAAQKMAFSNEYSQLIDTVSAGKDSGQLSDTQVKAALTRAKRDLVSRGASADDLMATEIKSLKTVAGMALTEETPEEAAEKKRYADFAGSRYWEYGASKEKQEDNRRTYEKSRIKNQGLDLELEEAQLAMAKKQMSESERIVAENNLITAKRNKIQGVLRDYPLTFHNELQEIRQEVASVRESQGDGVATALLKQRVNQVRDTHLNNISNIAAQTSTGLPAQHSLATETINRLANSVLTYEGSGDELVEVEAERDLLLAKAEVASLEDIETLSSAVIESIIPGSGNLLQQGVVSRVKSAKSLIKAAQERADGDPVPNLSPNTEEGRAMVEITEDMLKEVGEADKSGRVRIDPEATGNNVSAHLAYLGSLSDGTDIKEMRDVVSFLANPDFASFVQKYPQEIKAKDMAQAQQALVAYQERVGQSTLNLLSKTISAEEKSKKLGKYATAHKKVLMHEQPTEEGLEVKFVNGQVVVVATAVGSRQVAKELTEKVNQPLTEVINASAAISNQSPEAIFNEWLPSLWPSKYGEEQTQEQSTQELSAQDIDWSQYEDGTYEGPDGTQYTVTDGVLVEAGS